MLPARIGFAESIADLPAHIADLSAHYLTDWLIATREAVTSAKPPSKDTDVVAVVFRKLESLLIAVQSSEGQTINTKFCAPKRYRQTAPLRGPTTGSTSHSSAPGDFKTTKQAEKLKSAIILKAELLQGQSSPATVLYGSAPRQLLNHLKNDLFESKFIN
ncbi:hypothetical protein TYRP_017007 [Tyrophagus putrescentiae]|nr:hypothetical protein TYRP_017007 [Tyrophagus putrescentiae]